MSDKPPLPEGWIIRTSRSYPDRVYYFNINTGESSWEFPDIIQAGQIIHIPPLSPQRSTNDNGTKNKRKLTTPTNFQSPTEKSSYPSAQNKSDRVNEPARKKAKFSPIKFPSSGSAVKSGIVNQFDETGKVTRNLKQAFDGSAKNAVTNLKGQHSLNQKSFVPDTKSPNKICLSNNKKYSDSSGCNTGTSKVLKTASKSAHTESKSSISRLKVPESGNANSNTVTKGTVGKPDLNKASQKTKVNTSQQSLAKLGDIKRPTNSIKIKNDSKCDKTLVVDSKVKKDVNKIDLTAESDSDDRRKVVKSLQQESKRTDRKVIAANGKQLTVKAATGDINNPIELDTPNNKLLFNLGNESPISLADSDNEVKLKNFIGNKDKLLSIQSWIDNLQEGSDSPRKEFYGLQSMLQDPDVKADDTTDSGFLSPSGKQDRGWPGAVKPSMVSSRQLIEMEVEPWHLPEVDTSRVEEAMEVDIDEVISEVRHIIKLEASSGENQTEESWEPKSSEQPITQGVVLVIDTNVFLTNLKLVETLKDNNIPEFGRPTLFIPWVVLKELDYMKSSSETKHKDMKRVFVDVIEAVQTKARKATWLLKSLFSQKLSNIRGQTLRQYGEASNHSQPDCNDDSILQACLQCKQLYDSCEIILLTNDNNLIVKSLVTGVPAYTSNEIHDGLKSLKSKLIPETNNNIKLLSSQPLHNQTASPLRHSSAMSHLGTNTVIDNQHLQKSVDSNLTCTTSVYLPGSSLSSTTKYNTAQSNNTYPNGALSKCDNLNYSKIPLPHPSQPQCMADNLLQEEQHYTMENLLEDMHTKLINLLKEGFGKVLEEEMKLAYDDIWLQVVFKKPPWSLLDILECWKKHWRAIFGMVFKRSLISNVERLVCAFISKIAPSLRSVCDISKDSIEILQECVQRNRYGDPMFGIKECVTCIYELCEDLIHNNITIQSIFSLSNYLKSKLVPERCSNSIISPQNSVHSDGPSKTIPQPSSHPPHNQLSFPQSQLPRPSLQVIPHSPEVQPPGHLVGQPSAIQHQIVMPSLIQSPSVQPHMTVQSPVPQPLLQPVLLSPGMPPLVQPITQSQLNLPHSHHPIVQSPSILPHSHHMIHAQQTVPHQHYNSPTQGYVDQLCNQDSISNSSASAMSGRLNCVHATDQPPGDKMAGELLQQIWHFLTTMCHRIAQAISDKKNCDVEKLLHQIVPVAKDLRIMYVGILEIPVPKLSSHELDFTHFTDLCNSFLSKCGEQVSPDKSKVSPVSFLMLFSNMAHRQTLLQLQAQLDDMLRHLYQCLHIVFPDD